MTDPPDREIFGRDREISELLALLTDTATLGVVLSGGPGIGKTRLARAVASAYASVSGAETIGFDGSAYEDPGAALIRLVARLRERPRAARDGGPGGVGAPPLILVEGLVEGLAEADHGGVPAAVARAGVRLIVTAREPLAAASSAGFAARTVGPLPVPFDCSALDLDSMCRIPSVRLYVASLRALNPAFRVQHDNQEAVARTCAELRGIPGALVLAARIAALEGPEVLWAALDGRFDPGPEGPPGAGGDSGSLARLLDAYGGPAPATPSSRATPSPRAAATDPDASVRARRHPELGDAERRLLACSRLFSGGAGPEALRRIAGVPLNAFPAALETLLGRHLLSVSALPSGRLDGFTRTRLHIPFEPSVPTAGPDSAPAPAHDNPRLSHARYYAELARTAARRIAEGDQYAGITAFRSEERNIRCALDTLIGVGAADEATALVDHARTYWYASGAPFTWAERLTALPETPADTPRRTRLNLLLAEAAIRAGEPEAALALLGQADADRAAVVGRAERGDEAADDAEEALLAARLLHLRGIAEAPHRPGEALAALHTAVAGHRSHIGDGHALHRVMLDASLAEFLHGSPAKAMALAVEALSGAIRRRDVLVSGTALLQLSVFAAARGREAEADGYFDRAVAGLRTLGAPAVLGALLSVLGTPLLPRTTARAADVVRCLGACHAARGAGGLLDEPGYPDFTVGRLEGHMRRHLGERGFLAALSDGAGTPLPDLVKEFAARCGRLQPAPDPDPGRNPNVTRNRNVTPDPLMSATSDRDAATPTNRSLATARPEPRASAKPHPRPDRTAHPYAGPPDADGPTLPPAPGCGGPLPGDPLTPRQSQVSALITLGLSNKQIARRLQISEWTVVNHIRETMRKLGCSSRVEIANWVHHTTDASALSPSAPAPTRVPAPAPG
ncbi:LuxR C-terminal-related transcriptional regulator [Streptomyces sp. NBS 14/10]|uniref:LuxR C-terminal-related transcriptional regulator n=1 Tax=Streptomyces sp. NBS 14/10 TaxID=1945643 RepID=UPI00211B259C|nr:LuxR C-terminal-related transcriptional regulator [Streptomyces sp. NBS 14/10]KAK1184660.1 LuxR C-terminal-related transcriptional regulator [Streptomyces sp. NBS 14/10]